jgi:hypothetical protein
MALALMNIDTAKSYATETNLMVALHNMGLADSNPMVVRNRDGRWTAIFSASLGDFQGDMTAAARHGFKTFA